jgi:hypothetical protein
MKRLLPCYLTATVLVAYSGHAFVVNSRNCPKNGPRSSTTFVDTIATIATTKTRTGHRADKVKNKNGAGVVVLHAEWREYVPLIVSGAVIIDIVAGSPLVNAVMSFARPKETVEDNDQASYDDDTTTGNQPKERIDTKKVAAAAVERAQSVVAVRQMLEDNKTDWDRIKDLQRKVEQQQAEFDRSRRKKKK